MIGGLTWGGGTGIQVKIISFGCDMASRDRTSLSILSKCFNTLSIGYTCFPLSILPDFLCHEYFGCFKLHEGHFLLAFFE